MNFQSNRLAPKLGDITLSLIFFSLTLSFVTSSYGATSKVCEAYNHPQYQAEYKACLKIALTQASESLGADCKDCFLNNEVNPWVEALGIISMPLADFGAKYKSGSKSQDAWKKAWEDIYNSPENQENRKEFDKVLAELSTQAKAPLDIYDLQKYATLVTDYKILKSALDPKDLPTFEEFKKAPDAYITRSGFEMYAHKKDLCIDYKQEKYKAEYAKCRSINAERVGERVGGGIYGGTTMGMFGGGGTSLNLGIGFCTPNNDESECSTADGRVYKLDKGTNQLQRKLKQKKLEIDKNSPTQSKEAVRK